MQELSDFALPYRVGGLEVALLGFGQVEREFQRPWLRRNRVFLRLGLLADTGKPLVTHCLCRDHGVWPLSRGTVLGYY
jgi:hypothetical protein